MPLEERPDLAAELAYSAVDAIRERQELEQVALDVLGLLVFTAQHRVLEAAAPIPWKIGMALMSDPDDAVRRLALTLALDAVLQTPEAVLAAIRDVRERLAVDAPRLDVPR